MSETAERLRAEIAELLFVAPDELGLDDDLVDAGLDSIRVMTLIERWHRAGIRLGFPDLVAKPTIAAWADLLSRPADGRPA
ncbi:phosphopantetheine-binding protein [Nonomuraea sp. NPDC049695]|uniref:phosphopantetheine-binding protein n=1 Tax=Nonomuraea sp. NPDC049695 TaxID=3154734 RepID=UPI003420E481